MSGQVVRTAAAGSATLAKRFWPKVDVAGENECWNWTASLTKQGYGQISSGRRVQGPLLAHRVAYELIVGPIPDGLTLDHLCCNRRCVNPTHLEPVTNQENIFRSLKDHCKNGHEYTPDNTYHQRSGRRCRRCDRNSTREFYYRKVRFRNGLPPGDNRHGTASGYTNHRCRCDECRGAWLELKRKNYWRQKQQKEGAE